MLYKIDNKYYIKVQGYYKQVDVKVNGNNLDITPNGNEIEILNAKNVEALDTRINKDRIIAEINASKETEKQKVFSKIDDNDFIERRRNNRRRM